MDFVDLDQTVYHSIPFLPSTYKTGRDLVMAGLVTQVREIRQYADDGSLVQAMVQSLVISRTALTRPPYVTGLRVDGNRRVLETQCNCLMNIGGRCAHVAALICYLNNHV